MGDIDCDRLKPFCKIGADRTYDDKMKVGLAGMYAEGGIGRDHGRPDIQRSPGHVGDPLMLLTHKGNDGLKVFFFIYLGHRHPGSGAIEPFHIVPGAEQVNVAIFATISLAALEDLLRIM